MTDIVFVLMWKYSDNSGFGPVSVHLNRDSAEDRMKLLAEHAETKTFYIVPTDMVNE